MPQVSRKLRFEIFKRDNFTCQYCGRKTPDVILEIDHIIALSEGGDSDVQNLITSCYECNRGKGATPLGFVKTRDDLANDMLALAERELQLREYKKLLESIRQREDDDIDRITELVGSWCDASVALTHHGEATFRRFLKIFPVDRIEEAVNISATNTKTKDSERLIRYTYGILHTWRRNQGIAW